MTRLVLLSDSHLGPAPRDLHQANFDAVCAYVATQAPDAVISFGDVSFHGRVLTEDLQAAAAAHARLAAPWHAVAGNHDVGDSGPNPYGGWAITDARRAAYRTCFGAEWYARPIGDWRLVGVNAQLFGSGLEGEAEQWAFLEGALGNAGSQPTLIAIHKPPFIEHPHEGDRSPTCLPPPARDRLLDLIAMPGHGPRLVVSGHVHEHFERTHAGVRFVSLPSTASIHGNTPRHGGTMVIGVVTATLEGSDVALSLATPDGMTPFDVNAVHEDYDALKLPEPTA